MSDHPSKTPNMDEAFEMFLEAFSIRERFPEVQTDVFFQAFIAGAWTYRVSAVSPIEEELSELFQAMVADAKEH